MSLQLNIPDSVLQAMRMPQQRIEHELLKELAIALYSQERLSFSKAKELAQMNGEDFSQLVGERGVSRRCSRVEENGEFIYVCSE